MSFITKIGVRKSRYLASEPICFDVKFDFPPRAEA